MGEANDILKFLGARIRERRTEKQLSQEQFAFKSDLDRTYISGIERGKRNVSLNNLQSIANALKVPVAKLLAGFPSPHSTVSPSASDTYRIKSNVRIRCGFSVTSEDIAESANLTSAELEALPFTLFTSIDLKTLSGIVGALFAAHLAKRVGAIVNPIEKGHPDILPKIAQGASEAQLRNYPRGLEVKCTVGSVTKGSELLAGSRRVSKLTGIVWQAHHREVKGFLGLVVDFAGAERDKMRYPVITAAFYANNLIEDDWGAISGTKGRNTKVTAMLASGKLKMAEGWILILDEKDYKKKYCTLLPFNCDQKKRG
jgi:transcriptional regulator with XRE-family HTH domain